MHAVRPTIALIGCLAVGAIVFAGCTPGDEEPSAGPSAVATDSPSEVQVGDEVTAEEAQEASISSDLLFVPIDGGKSVAVDPESPLPEAVRDHIGSKLNSIDVSAPAKGASKKEIAAANQALVELGVEVQVQSVATGKSIFTIREVATSTDEGNVTAWVAITSAAGFPSGLTFKDESAAEAYIDKWVAKQDDPEAYEIFAGEWTPARR